MYYLCDVFQLSYKFSNSMAHDAFVMCNQPPMRGQEISLQDINDCMSHKGSGNSLVPFLEKHINPSANVQYRNIFHAIDKREQKRPSTRKVYEEEDYKFLSPHGCEYAEWIVLFEVLRESPSPWHWAHFMDFLQKGRLPEGRMRSYMAHELRDVRSLVSHKRGNHNNQKSLKQLYDEATEKLKGLPHSIESLEMMRRLETNEGERAKYDRAISSFRREETQWKSQQNYAKRWYKPPV